MGGRFGAGAAGLGFLVSVYFASATFGSGSGQIPRASSGHGIGGAFAPDPCEAKGVTLPAGVDKGWLSKVQEQIRAEEYNILWVDDPDLPVAKGAWLAPNRAQRFETRFSGRGLCLTPIGDESATWEFGLELLRWGREGALQDTGPGKISISANRFELDRSDVHEWYINDERGLEQGFTILKPPAESRRGGAPSPPVAGSNGVGPQRAREGAEALPYGLHLDLALTGDLHPRISEDGQAVDFYHPGGNVSVLRYAQLKVTDATGCVLPSRFEGWCGYGGQNAGGQNAHPTVLQPSIFNSQPSTLNSQPSTAATGGLRISIDDTEAVYPVTIDPVLSAVAWSVGGEFESDYFGMSVATAGDVNGDGFSDILVGAPGFNSYTGKAYLFLGRWSDPSFTPAWTQTGGGYVATAGDVNGDGYSDVIVGGNNTAKVFLGGPSGLASTPFWSASGSDNYGESLSTAGDVNGDGYSDIVVGAYRYDSWKGRVYLYTGGPSGLTASTWSPAGENGGDQFGKSVSTAGDVNGDGCSDVVVGAYGFDGSRGKAYLYLGGSSGLTASSWSPAGEALGDNFACSVATAGDVNGDGYSDIIIGALAFDSGADQDAGRVYLYLGGASGPSATASWLATGERAGRRLGAYISTGGDVDGDGYADVSVGGPGSGGFAHEAYLFLGGPGGLSPTPGQTLSPLGLGTVLVTAGDVNGDGLSDILAGNYAADNWTGSASLYLGQPSGILSAASWGASGENTADRFSYSLGSVGDVNGDGYSDVIVGAYNSASGTGKAYLYLGGAYGLSSTASWTKTGENTENFFGYSVASAGDVNGDGYADVVVGAYNHSGTTGKVYVYAGGASGLGANPSWTAVGETSGDQFGICVATAGDVNGDGYSDLLVGADAYDYFRGRAYLYLGGPFGLSGVPVWTGTGEAQSHQYGACVASAGDVNGDGYSDILVSAMDYGYPFSWGKVYLYSGGPSGPSIAHSWSALGEGGKFGGSLGTAGDINGDGYSDVVVGAGTYESGPHYIGGKAFLYMGGPSGLAASASWTAYGEMDYAMFGTSVATAGDVNGDGYSDVLVGAPFDGPDIGKSYLYLGGPSGLSSAAAWTASGASAGDFLGFCVSGSGDINGDGYADILLGAYGQGGDKGSCTSYYGNGGPGVPVIPRQLRSDLSTPISPLGGSGGNQFALSMRGRTPYGRGKVKLEWQFAPLGFFYPAASPVFGASIWTDTGMAGTPVTGLVSLIYEVPYVWRVRTKFNPVSTPYQSHGAWVTLAANGLMETDLRRLPTCVLPDEPCWIYSVVKAGADWTLNWEDPNQATQRTGWNIRRSNDPSLLPKTAWPTVCSNCVDMDAGTANYQWTDHSGDDPGSGGVWYYEVTTYNANCPAEGPF